MLLSAILVAYPSIITIPDGSFSNLTYLYFVVATFTTLGYGDIHPTSNEGYFFTILTSVYGITFMITFLGILLRYLDREGN